MAICIVSDSRFAQSAYQQMQLMMKCYLMTVRKVHKLSTVDIVGRLPTFCQPNTLTYYWLLMVQVDDHQCVIYVGDVFWNSSDYQNIELHHAVMIVGYQWCYWVLHDNNEVYDFSSRMSDKSINRKVWEVFSV